LRGVVLVVRLLIAIFTVVLVYQERMAREKKGRGDTVIPWILNNNYYYYYYYYNYYY